MTGISRKGTPVRVLIVEDEYLIAVVAREALEEAGCEITGVAGAVTKALNMLAERACDAALLDANLNGESAEPVAAALRRRGIPFLVASGYGTSHRPGALADAPYLSKPYREADLVKAIFALSASRGAA